MLTQQVRYMQRSMTIRGVDRGGGGGGGRGQSTPMKILGENMSFPPPPQKNSYVMQE